MAEPNVITGNLHVGGSITCNTINLPDSSVDDDAVEAGANIAATKLQHQHRARFSQKHGTAAATERHPVHIVRGASGTLIAFRAALVVACVGDSTVVVDLLKNGSSVLSATISFDSGDAAFAVLSGTLSSTSLATNDVLEVSVTATVGTGTLGQGLIVDTVIHEEAQ